MASGDEHIENELYTVRDVIAGRVDTTGEDGRASVSVVVAPEADIDAVSRQLLDLLTDKLGRTDSRALDLRVTPLGDIDGSVSVSAETPLRVHAETAGSMIPSITPEPDRSERVALDAVVAAVHEGRLSVEVALRSPDGVIATGAWTASAVASARARAVAEATLAAITQVAVVGPCFVEVAEVVQRADRAVALVVLVLGDDGPDEIVTGSAVVKGAGTADAVARAVLHALNRRMNLIRS